MFGPHFNGDKERERERKGGTERVSERKREEKLGQGEVIV